MTISPIQPSLAYDANNEAQFRSQVRQEDAKALKTDQAITSFIVADDTGATYTVTFDGTGFIFTAITP
jgi:hypothetical protein